MTMNDVKRLRNQLKGNTNISSKKLTNLVQQTVINQTQKAIENQTIPGLVTSGANVDERNRIMELTYISSLIAKKLVEKSQNKYHLCFIVNAIVNMLGLKEEDFDEFHRKFSEFQNGESNDE